MLLRGTPLKQGYTLAIGCYNLRFYVAESGHLLLGSVLCVLWLLKKGFRVEEYTLPGLLHDM